MGYLIGIDVGTSGTKTLIIDERGKILATVTEEYPLYSPKPLWSEQNPADRWRATVTSVKKVIKKAKVNGKEVKGIGLSGQMHGLVCLDARNRVLRPAILWNDQRTGEECEEITEKVGKKKLLRLVCNPALTGFTAPKILWVRKHEPRVYDRTKKILLPKDYIRFMLTGEYATEVSDASGMLLLDIRKRKWCDELLRILDIDKSLLPTCYESPEVTGKTKPDVSEQLGIPAGTPVVGGGGDQAAGAVGNGIVKTGIISATLGTSGVVFAFADRVETDPLGRVHTFCHAVPNKWHIMGVMLSAGGSFQWWRNNLGQLEVEKARKRGVDPYDLLCKEAEKAEAGCEGLIFLPYLTGERTPHANPNARGGWIGLTARHTKAHMIRSVLEGITYGMRDSLEIIKEMGVKVKQIRVSGGGARSKFWRQIQADVYRQAVCTINATEGPAFGVALLAGVGTGVFGSVEEACEATIKVTSTTKPIPRNMRVYEKFYPIYRRLYQSLKEDFDIITAAVG
ncbi:MAG: xylulokinase [Thermoplasmata archaeon]|nr:MAG: xylulokinase [Thermoplasmata archaeon]